MSQSYGQVPAPNDSHLSYGYGNANSGVNDFAQGNPSATMTSPLGQSMGEQGFGGQFHEDFDAPNRPVSSVVDGHQGAGMNRSASTASTAVGHGQANQGTPSRNNTLKKKVSMRRTGSLKRSSSRKSLAAGSIKSVGGRSVGGGTETEDFNSAFHTPIPTQGSPTDILANRFQSWRQLLKSLIAYFREIQNSYDARAKAIGKVQHAMGGIAQPAVFVSHNGLGDATRILEDFHRHSVAEANKSREIENDVIAGLSGLRSDLNQKIKEIKSLSGDFKNSVDKEKEATRREVEKLQDALQHADHEDGVSAKNDPYVVRLGVDRMVEKQIDEENYLHRVSLQISNLTAGSITDKVRPTSTSKPPAVSSSPSLLVRFRRLTTLWPGSSSARVTMPTRLSKASAVARFPCLRTRSGLLSSTVTRTLSRLTFPCVASKTLTTPVETTRLRLRSVVVCWSARASTSSPTARGGMCCHPPTCTSSSLRTRFTLSRRSCPSTSRTRSSVRTQSLVLRAPSSC